ncbi:unnamed protein product [Sympodiomycopsis kandeliae]
MSDTSIPKVMKGLLLEKFTEGKGESDPYVYHENIPFDRDNLQPTEVIVKIAVAGMCHTDGMCVRGEFANMFGEGKGLPIVPSHEPTGTILAMGKDAAEKSQSATGGQRHLKVGDRVGSLCFKNFCGECADCKAGKSKFCEKTDIVGLTTNGGFAEYAKVDYRSCVLLPDSLPFEAAAPLCCAGITIWTAIKACNLSKGQHISIIGAGALGFLGCQFAKALGLKVTMVDARDAPLQMCKEFKYPADVILNNSNLDPSKQEDIAKAVSVMGGEPDATIVATDIISAFTLAIWTTKKHGHLQVVGQPKDDIPVNFFPLIFRDLKITGSLLGNQSDFKELVDFVAEKGIEVKTTSYGLTEVPKLLSDYTLPGHKGKLVVKVS